MKAPVIGASGQLGAALVAQLRGQGIAAVGTHCSRPADGSVPLDVRDRDAVRRCLEETAADLVFLAQNAPGGVDFCEEHPEEAQAVIVGGMRHVLEAADSRRARIALFSSDYVFDGRSGPYREDAEPGPISAYGKAKLEAERLLHSYPYGALIVRTTAVFSWAPGTKNFAMQIHERLRAGKAFRAPSDQWCNPTLAEYLAEACLRLVRSGRHGTFNVVGRDWMPRSQLAAALARAMSLDPALVQPVTTAELGQKARRPLKGGLTTDKISSALGEPPPDLARSLELFSARFRQDA